tara:strand:+ start:49 stop:465 length:417 start_codon:yes stop_codon:yes gene_type:complete
MIRDINIIREHLNGFVEVEIPYPFKRGEEIKYITLNKDNESFYVGGTFECLGNNCIILRNNHRRWQVATFVFNKDGEISYKSRFFVKDNDSSNCEKKNAKANETIFFQQDIIEKMNSRISELEHENKILKTYIKKLDR